MPSAPAPGRREVPPIPPQNLQAERAVLAAMIRDADAVPLAIQLLRQDDFYSPAHREVFRTIREMVIAGIPIDLPTVAGELQHRGALEAAGGAKGVSDLLDANPVPGHVEAHCALVLREARRRRLIDQAAKITSLCYETGLDAAEIIKRADADPELRPILAALGQMIDGDGENGGGLVCIDSQEFLAREYPAPEFMLEPWLHLQDIAMLYGWRGVGKTWVLNGIAGAVATGSSFLRWTAPKPRRVLLVDGEMPAGKLQDRLRAIEAMCGTPRPGYLKLIAASLQGRRGIPSLATSEGQQYVERHLDGVDLVVLDSLATLVRKNLNEAESWQPVQDWIVRLRAQGTTVTYGQHAGKSGAQRGLSNIEDVVDATFALKHPKDYTRDQGARFEITCEKGRDIYGDAVGGFEARLEKGLDGKPIWTTRTLEDAVLARILALKADGAGVTEIAREVGLDKSNVSRRLKAARQDGLLGQEGGQQ